ncbi:MAG: fumarate hydratase [Saccharofermentanales bacterium]
MKLIGSASALRVWAAEWTALGLQLEACPTHIAGLPVAVNLSCHVTRHAEATLASRQGSRTMNKTTSGEPRIQG